MHMRLDMPLVTTGSIWAGDSKGMPYMDSEVPKMHIQPAAQLLLFNLREDCGL